MPAPQTLSAWLSLLYRRRYNLLTAEERRAGFDHMAAFCKCLDGDPAMAAEAGARLARLESLAQRCAGTLGRRCAIQGSHLDDLRAALAAKGTSG